MFAELGRVSVFVCRNDAACLEFVFCKFNVCFSGAVVLTCDGGLVD